MGMLALRKELLSRRQGRPFELLLHMQAALRASMLSRFLPARRRIGFDMARAKDFQNWFVNEQISANPRQHVGEGFLEFVRYLGVQPQELQWNLPLSEQVQQEAAR